MRNTIILMTALVPTSGHADLIEFSANIPENKTYVLINGRDFEPVRTEDRVETFKHLFRNNPDVVIKGSIRNNAPQNPTDMSEGFWEWWKDEINKNFPEVAEKWDYVVASEPYGKQVADSLGADFLPYDLDRVYNACRGEGVRANIMDNWEHILPVMRQKLMLNAVLFGQESVGKTTISRILAEKLGASWTAEFARPYLETVGEELSMKKMESIHLGQAAYQKTVTRKAEKPIAVFDTDLMSTVGYYKLMNTEVPKECLKLSKMKNTFYYILPDSIPFVADILRYGGNKRESSIEFWINLLETNRKDFVLVPDGSIENKTNFIYADVLKRFEEKTYLIKSFVRD